MTETKNTSTGFGYVKFGLICLIVFFGIIGFKTIIDKRTEVKKTEQRAQFVTDSIKGQTVFAKNLKSYDFSETLFPQLIKFSEGVVPDGKVMVIAAWTNVTKISGNSGVSQDTIFTINGYMPNGRKVLNGDVFYVKGFKFEDFNSGDPALVLRTNEIFAYSLGAEFCEDSIPWFMNVESHSDHKDYWNDTTCIDIYFTSKAVTPRYLVTAAEEQFFVLNSGGKIFPRQRPR